MEAMYFSGPLQTDEQGLGDQQGSIYNTSALIMDVAWNTCQKRWTKGSSGDRRSEKSALRARRYDDDNDNIYLQRKREKVGENDRKYPNSTTFTNYVWEIKDETVKYSKK